MNPPEPVSEVARAIERTRLAWRRTGLAATALLAIGIFRLVLPHPAARTAIGVGVIALAWIGLLLAVQYRITRLDAAELASDAMSAGTMRRAPVVLALLVALCALGALLVLG